MKLKNFLNQVTNSNMLFSREDIGNMSRDEFRQNEKAIDYQLKSIGVPTNGYLSMSDDVVFVKAYTKDDGTEVRAHYRSKPDNGVSTANISPLLHGSISNRDELNSQLNTYDKAFEGLSQGTYNKTLLNQFNNMANRDYKDARDLMNIALDNPQTLYNTAEYTVFKPQDNSKIGQFLDYNYKKDKPTIVFKDNSSLSKSLSNSLQLQNTIRKQLANRPKNTYANSHFTTTVGDDSNLTRSIHGCTVVNPYIDKSGYVNAYVFDFYDYNLLLKNYKDNPRLTFMNNSAFVFQEIGKLKNYYIFVPIKFKY